MKIRRPTRVPRTDGKRIDEWVGVVNTQTDSLSVARMWAPPGWVEPPQTPEFDEVVLVLKGALTLQFARRKVRIGAGELGLVRAGQRVTFRNDASGACDYYSICGPAFRPERAHFEALGETPAANLVDVEARTANARRHRGWVMKRAQQFLARVGLRNCELSIALVGDAQIRKLNREWRKKDKSTDVLSFPAGDVPVGTPGPRPLGDIIISVDTARRAAREDGRSVEEEISRYLAHGLLHLLGHDHHRPAEAKRMAAEEDKLLGGRGMVSTSRRASRLTGNRARPAP